MSVIITQRVGRVRTQLADMLVLKKPEDVARAQDSLDHLLWHLEYEMHTMSELQGEAQRAQSEGWSELFLAVAVPFDSSEDMHEDPSIGIFLPQLRLAVVRKDLDLDAMTKAEFLTWISVVMREMDALKTELTRGMASLRGMAQAFVHPNDPSTWPDRPLEYDALTRTLDAARAMCRMEMSAKPAEARKKVLRAVDQFFKELTDANKVMRSICAAPNIVEQRKKAGTLGQIMGVGELVQKYLRGASSKVSQVSVSLWLAAVSANVYAQFEVAREVREEIHDCHRAIEEREKAKTWTPVPPNSDPSEWPHSSPTAVSVREAMQAMDEIVVVSDLDAIEDFLDDAREAAVFIDEEIAFAQEVLARVDAGEEYSGLLRAFDAMRDDAVFRMAFGIRHSRGVLWQDAILPVLEEWGGTDGNTRSWLTQVLAELQALRLDTIRAASACESLQAQLVLAPQDPAADLWNTYQAELVAGYVQQPVELPRSLHVPPPVPVPQTATPAPPPPPATPPPSPPPPRKISAVPPPPPPPREVPIVPPITTPASVPRQRLQPAPPPPPPSPPPPELPAKSLWRAAITAAPEAVAHRRASISAEEAEALRRIRVVHNDIVWYGKRPGFSHGPFSGPSLWFRLSLLIDAYERKFDKDFDRTLIDPALLLK